MQARDGHIHMIPQASCSLLRAAGTKRAVWGPHSKLCVPSETLGIPECRGQSDHVQAPRNLQYKSAGMCVHACMDTTHKHMHARTQTGFVYAREPH